MTDIQPERKMTFDSNYEPAKPSQVIMQMLTEKMRKKRMAVIHEDVGFMANADVFDDLDAYIERLLQAQRSRICGEIKTRFEKLEDRYGVPDGGWDGEVRREMFAVIEEVERNG